MTTHQLYYLWLTKPFSFLASVFCYRSALPAEELPGDSVTLYMKLRGPFLTLEEYDQIMAFENRSAYHIALFNASKDYFVDDWDRFIELSFHHVVQVIIFSSAAAITSTTCVSYGPFLKVLIDHGLDVCKPTLYSFPNRYGSMSRINTMLSALIAGPSGIQRWEIIQSGKELLKVLKSCSVDLDRFLEHELQCLAMDIDEARVLPSWWSSSAHLAKLEFIHDILRPELAPTGEEGSTDDLLKLMPALRRDLIRLNSGMQGRIPSHLDWKHERTDDPYRTAWPFQKDLYWYPESDRKLKNLSQRQLQLISTYDKFVDLIDERFERNQQRKWNKMIKGNHISEHSINMPGTWRMEWWEYRGSW